MNINRFGSRILPALAVSLSLPLALSTTSGYAADAIITDESQPVTEAPWVDGIFSLALGVGFVDSDDSQFSSDTVFKLQGDARVRFGDADGLSFQLETLGSYAGLYNDDGDAESAFNAFQAGAHIFQRDSQSHAVGAFLSFSGTSAIDDDSKAGTLLVGAEMAQFADNSTYVLQGGYAKDVLNDGDSWTDGWFARGILRHFITPHSKLEAEVAYGGGSFDRSDEGDPFGLTWGIEYEHQVDMSPVSYFARYEGWHVDLDDDDDDTHTATEHAVMIGLRTRFGFGSLLEQDRYGAGTFDLFDTAAFAGVPDEL